MNKQQYARHEQLVPGTWNLVPSAASAAAVLLLLTGCGDSTPQTGAPEPSGATVVSRTKTAMGSDVQISAWTADRQAAVSALDAVFAEFDRLESIMSVWREGSEIVRLNAAAGHHAVPIGPDMQRVLGAARQVSEWTGGKFDVTFGALSGLWKFDHDQDNKIPDMAAVRERLPLVDYTALDLDERAGTAFLKRAGMRVHLGGIGKGYAIDRGVEILRTRGVSNFIIQSGGDLYVSGARGDRPWRVGIRDPRGPAESTMAAIDLTNATFSTSGDYERFFIQDGRRYHHILDPDAGEPARGCQSVTIVAEKAMMADGLSTGVFILGPSAGMMLIEKLPNVEGVIVTDHGEMLVSTGLKDRLLR
jgi:thiamine biosynthesis lipoprotein